MRGYSGIEKARWKLKCQLCSEAHGTKGELVSGLPFSTFADPLSAVQCTKGKCAKAVHVTCAMHVNSGFHLDATVPGEAGHASVSLLDQARSEMDPSSPQKSKVAISQRSPPKAEHSALPPGSESGAPVAEVDDSIKLTVLCRTHNPVRALAFSCPKWS